jgi:myo-inositol-1(or 4)-monophosphatase
MTAAPADDLTLIVQAARTAGRLALDCRTAGLTLTRKADGTPVTDGDLAVDALLTHELRGARPDYGWLSEETPDDDRRLSTRRQFVVDPIDGTSAYLKAKPWFAVSIAVVQDGRPVAGVVFAPALGELYAASLGGGASCNGAAISASGTTRLEGALILAGAGVLAARPGRAAWPPMRVEQRNALAYRVALVAAGRVDVAYSPGPKNDWDIAAGDLIAREAGAHVSDASGRPLRFNTAAASNAGLVACAPALAPLILPLSAPIEPAVER